MNTLSIAAAAALSLASISPTVAAETTGAAPAATAQSDNSEAESEAKVCRRIPVTGSRLQAKKICATPAEWRAMARAADDTIAEERKQGR
jgi:hypothetical protein